MTLDKVCYARYENLAQNEDHQKISVILLSILRKILAVCLMKLRNPRIDKELPPSQAAYRKGRSTTEHVFATKLIIERTITSKNETFYLPMYDMSKAFDSINRTTLIQDLNVIDKDELHFMKMLLDVNLAVKCNNHIGGGGEFFHTDQRTPQGDWASATEFIFYLARSLQFKEQPISMQVHNYCKT